MNLIKNGQKLISLKITGQETLQAVDIFLNIQFVFVFMVSEVDKFILAKTKLMIFKKKIV